MSPPTDRYAGARPVLKPVIVADDPMAPAPPPPTAEPAWPAAAEAPAPTAPAVPAPPTAQPAVPPAPGGGGYIASSAAPSYQPAAPPPPRQQWVQSGIRLTPEMKERLLMRKVRTGEDLQDFANRIFDAALRAEGF